MLLAHAARHEHGGNVFIIQEQPTIGSEFQSKVVDGFAIFFAALRERRQHRQKRAQHWVVGRHR